MSIIINHPHGLGAKSLMNDCCFDLCHRAFCKFYKRNINSEHLANFMNWWSKVELTEEEKVFWFYTYTLADLSENELEERAKEMLQSVVLAYEMRNV